MSAGSPLMNPFTEWFGKYINAMYLEYKNRDKCLKIGYMSYSKNCHFGNRVTLYNFVNAHNASFGDFSYVADRTRIKNARVGKYCSIGPDCRIGLGRHPASTFVSTHPIFFSPDKQAQITFADKSYFAEFAEINIGNDVWIGANAIVGDGVTISDGAIAAAGSVVTKDVPPYAIVAGVPAKVIKYRFSSEIIQMLLELRWWDRDVDDLKKNLEMYHDVEKLRAKILTRKRGNRD